MSKHINMHIDAFVEMVGSSLELFERDLKIIDVSKSNDKHMRTAKINDNIVFILWCVPKRRIIKSLMCLTTGNGQLEFGVDILCVFASIIMAVSGVEKEAATKAAVNLILTHTSDTVIINGIKYTFSKSTGLGLLGVEKGVQNNVK
jgi:hypothetical protein